MKTEDLDIELIRVLKVLFRGLLIIVFWCLLIFVLWSLISYLNLINPLFLPPPSKVYFKFIEGIKDGYLLKDLFITAGRSFLGFSISLLIGVPLGLIIGRSPFLSEVMQPILDFFRSIPATALFPLFLFLFGIGDLAKVMVVVYACSLIILVNTAYGAMKIKQARVLSAIIIGADKWDIFWKIVVPESMPEIFAGARIAISLSFVLIIVTEMFIGTTVGLGYRIINAQMIYQSDEMYAAIILAGLIGYLTNRCFLLIERRYLHWIGN